jgi:hypothetical protein
MSLVSLSSFGVHSALVGVVSPLVSVPTKDITAPAPSRSVTSSAILWNDVVSSGPVYSPVEGSRHVTRYSYP